MIDFTALTEFLEGCAGVLEVFITAEFIWSVIEGKDNAKLSFREFAGWWVLRLKDMQGATESVNYKGANLKQV